MRTNEYCVAVRFKEGEIVHRSWIPWKKESLAFAKALAKVPNVYQVLMVSVWGEGPPIYTHGPDTDNML